MPANCLRRFCRCRWTVLRDSTLGLDPAMLRTDATIIALLRTLMLVRSRTAATLILNCGLRRFVGAVAGSAVHCCVVDARAGRRGRWPAAEIDAVAAAEVDAVAAAEVDAVAAAEVDAVAAVCWR